MSIMKIKGAEKLMKRLQRLEKKDAKNAMRAGLRAGTAIILKAVKAATPVDEGVLRRMQASKVRLKGLGGLGIVGADVAKLRGDAKRPPNIDHLVEYGHVMPNGAFAPPTGYMRKASEQAIPAAEAAFIAKLKEKIG